MSFLTEEQNECGGLDKRRMSASITKGKLGEREEEGGERIGAASLLTIKRKTSKSKKGKGVVPDPLLTKSDNAPRNCFRRGV